MVEYLLDTDHTIEMVNNNLVVQNRVADLGPEKFAISEITLAEMCVRLSKTGLEKYERQIAFLENHFHIISFSAHREYGAIRGTLERKGLRLDDMDVLIAATALRNNLTLVTGNTRHFDRVKPLRLLNFLD